MKVYLAGPMTGLPDYNFPAFMKAATSLRELGHTVFNPAEADLQMWGDMETIKQEANYRDCLRVDLNWILDHAEVIALLPGWVDSKGATLELMLAELLGLEVWGLPCSD
jgi:hypothetical protein